MDNSSKFFSLARDNCTDRCFPTPGAAFRNGALSWNNRGWQFKFTPQDDGTLKGTLTTSNGVNAVTKTRL